MYNEICVFILIVLNSDWVCSSDSNYLRGPALVEKNPLLLNSFLPAALQVIAHCTELLKYDVRPAGPNPTSTTFRPTPPHSPGVYAPRSPPPTNVLRKITFEEYMKRLKQSQGASYFDKYKIPIQPANLLTPKNVNLNSDAGANQWTYFKSHDIEKDLELLGRRPTALLKQIVKDEDYDFIDEELNVQRYADEYGDASFRNVVIGNKVVPPSQAYVTLLTLHDLLNKESKKLQLNKYSGYTENVLKALVETSSQAAAGQLYSILNKVLEHRDTNERNIINKINALMEDINQENSYINLALRYIPPLAFSL